MNKLGGFFSRLRKPKHESSTEKFSVKHTEGITDSNILQSNEYNVQVDDVSNDSVILSNDSIEVSLVTESKGLPNNNNVEKRLTEEKEVLQSNDKKQVRTKESIERKGIKIVKILNKMNACKKVINVNEAKEVKNVTNDEILSDLLNQLYNNKNLIVTKVTAEDKSTNMDWNISENKIEDNIEHIQDKMKNKQTTEPIFPDLAKLLHTTNVKLANHTNLTTRIVDSMNSNECSKMQYINDQTTKCLKEFDKVLAEVQGNYNSDKAQALTLGIDDIILVKELDIDDILNIDDIFDNEDLNVDSTYYFQEIKHTTSNIDEKDLIVTGHTVQVGTTEIHSENTSKIETEDIDVISISSDDNNLNINENNSVTVEAVKNNGSENNEKEFNIILNSDKENEFLLQCNKSVKSKELKGSEQSKAFDKTKRVKVAKNSKVTCTEAIKSPKEINNSDQTKDSEEKVSQDIFDTISISSDEHLETISIGSSKHESDDCGYHSSDFEFISEGEAKKDGFIINFVIERQNLNKAKVFHNLIVFYVLC